jgi:endoglucanase
VFELIKELTELAGPVGQEAAVLDAIEPLWQAAGAHTERTRLGNVVGRAGGAGPRLLLVAHADELCYLVRSVDPGGFLWLANGQGWQRKASLREWFTVGQRVTVMARFGPIPGVIASATGHLAFQALPEPSELTWMTSGSTPAWGPASWPPAASPLARAWSGTPRPCGSAPM